MTGREDVFQQALNQGHSAAWDQKWDQAAEKYRSALKEFPEHPTALTNLGLALYELGDYEESLKFYLKAVKLSPEDPYLMEKVAQLYEIIGNTDHAQSAALRAAELYIKKRDAKKAIDNWRMVTRQNPENLLAHTRLAVIYERLGKTNEAVKEYINMAALFQHADELDKSNRAIKHAIEILPGSPEAHQAMALLQSSESIPLDSKHQGEVQQTHSLVGRAIEKTEESSQIDPLLDPVAETSQKALAVLAGMVFEDSDDLKNKSTDKGDFQTIIHGAGSQTSNQIDHNRVKLHLSQVVDLQTRGEKVQAATELERAMAVGLDHAAAYYYLGFLRLEADRMESAKRNLQNAVRHPDYALGSRILLGQALQKMGRMSEASIEFMEALRLADAAVVPNDLADDLSQLYDPIIEAQRQETDLEFHKRIIENISEILIGAGWREHLRKAREQLPQQVDDRPLVPLAEIMIQSSSNQVVASLVNMSQLEDLGYLRSAMEEAYYALQFAPTYLPLHANIGELLLKQDQVQEAIDKILMVARSYSMRGEAQHAVEYYRRIINLVPLDLNPRRLLIDQLIALNRVEEALNEHMDYADIYYRMADLEMARETYAEALNLANQSRPGSAWRVRILHRMADIDLQSLEWRQALDIFEQIRSLQPGDENARHNLVILNFRLGLENKALGEIDNYLIYLRKSGDQRVAIEFLESLIREVPNRLALRNRLAQNYYKLGRNADAITQLDAVGEILIEAGDIAGAIKTVEAILALNPPNIIDYQKLLKQLQEKQ